MQEKIGRVLGDVVGLALFGLMIYLGFVSLELGAPEMDIAAAGFFVIGVAGWLVGIPRTIKDVRALFRA